MELVKSDKNVADLSRPITMHMAPIDVLLAQDIQFKPKLGSTEISENIDGLKVS